MPLGKVQISLERREEGEVTLRRGGLGQPLSNQLRNGRKLIHQVLQFLAHDTHAPSLFSLTDADHHHGVEEEAVAARPDKSEPKANGTLMARSPVA